MMMILPKKCLGMWALFIILISVTTVVMCGKVPIKKRSLVDVGDLNNMQREMRPSKRTFCNAFTGCGRKRSGDGPPAPPPQSNKDYEYDSSSAAENSPQSEDFGVDDMARDILAEARLWEALQARNSMRVQPQHLKHVQGGRQKRSIPAAGVESKNVKEASIKTPF